MITLKENREYVADIYGNITKPDNLIISILIILETEKALLIDVGHQFENTNEEVKCPFEK